MTNEEIEQLKVVQEAVALANKHTNYVDLGEKLDAAETILGTLLGDKHKSDPREDCPWKCKADSPSCLCLRTSSQQQPASSLVEANAFICPDCGEARYYNKGVCLACHKGQHTREPDVEAGARGIRKRAEFTAIQADTKEGSEALAKVCIAAALMGEK